MARIVVAGKLQENQQGGNSSQKGIKQSNARMVLSLNYLVLLTPTNMRPPLAQCDQIQMDLFFLSGIYGRV